MLKKFTAADFNGQDVKALPDKIENQAASLKARFDNVGETVLADGINSIVDALAGTGGAAEIGTADASTVQQSLNNHTTQLSQKVDKVSGMGLSQESFSTAEKTKLAGVATNANNYILPVATSAVLGGVKQGTGVEILADGTLNGLASPAPDLVAREAIETHAADTDIHVTAAEKSNFNGHIADTAVHVTAEEKEIYGNKSASAITAGTFAGMVKGDATAMAEVTTAQFRNISASTTDMTAGTTALPTGAIYLMYE